VLPVGATETGTWAFNTTATAGTEVAVPISFPIRLAEELEEGDEVVHFQGEAEFTVNCPGAVTLPIAPSGHLCVYFNAPGEPTNATLQLISDPSHGHQGAGVAGALLNFEVTGSPADGFGAWAVTG
jgi:hypothetical protein